MKYDELVTLNLGLCMFVFWACVCRLKMTSRNIKLNVRARYIAIGSGSLFGGLGHWLFPFYGGGYLGLVIFVLSIVVGFWLDKKDWSSGPPPSAHSQPGDLHE